MTSLLTSDEIVSFGEFEANLRSRELLRNGSKLRLPDQSFQVLAMLLEHPGELVGREEIRKKLWPEDTFVDFDHGLNNAVNRLREALGDSATSPHLIETLPRRGYRFVGVINGTPRLEMPPALDSNAASLKSSEANLPGVKWSNFHKRRLGWITFLVAALLILLLTGLNFQTLQHRLFSKSSSAEAIRSLVVLPLENLSGDPSQEYFADGMTDALITDLASVSSLRVISRTSAMHYKGSHQSLPEIAGELKVDAVIEGSFVRSGKRVRVNAQLVQASSDRHLWAKTYDRDIGEILSLQQDIARSIVREIQVKLTPTEENKLAGAGPVKPEAYEASLKGHYYWNKRSLEGYNKGLEYFKQALEASPNYAPAYVGTALCYNFLGLGMGSISPIEAAKRAKSAAQRAIELDDSLADAHGAMAFTLHRYDWNWAEAEKEYKRAMKLDPHNPQLRGWYVELLDDLGRTEEARALREQIREMDPFSVGGVRGIAGAYFQAKQYDQGIAYYRKVMDSEADTFRLRMDLAAYYLENKHYPEAEAEYQKVMTLYGQNIYPNARLGYTYALSGQNAKAEKILEQLKKDGRPGYPSFASAQIYAVLGRKEEALRWLQKAYVERAPHMVRLNRDSAFAALGPDSRFQELVRRVGLVPKSIQK